MKRFTWHQVWPLSLFLAISSLAAWLLLSPQTSPPDHSSLSTERLRDTSDIGASSGEFPDQVSLPDESLPGQLNTNIPDRESLISTPTRDNTKTIDFAKLRQRGLGDIPDDVLSLLCNAFSKLELQAADRRLEFYAREPEAVLSVEFADIELDFFGGPAKMDALLAGDYVLVPFGQSPPSSDRYHTLLAPGGIKDGTEYNTYIYVDLTKYTDFAQALRNYSYARKRKDLSKQQK